ncbi:MAG TPA: anaerobic ribonucleoside-triphosphate reductase [Candidatus Altiarchaeales archaeon]|nr:anaerobic ribonucleoside-triphosphate reductase [Candidatus Altiarchaeales archaeon]
MVDLAFLHKGPGIRVLKSDGSTERFDADKIISSCMSAGASSTIASEIASEVSGRVYDKITTKEIRAMIYTQLRKRNLKLAERYRYRTKLRVRTSKTTLDRFDRRRIVDSLIKETEIDSRLAETIARDVEKELGRMRLDYVTAPLIREIVNVKLLEYGLEGHRARYTRLGMPVYDVKNLIEKPPKENANLQYNPETIHKLMADQISKEYALINILPVDLADAHMNGEIHIHDLDYFTRPFCENHDIRFFLLNGFRADGVGNHTAVAGPAKRPEVAFLHATKVLAASQTNCAGGQGFSYFNTFLAPYVEGLSYDKIKQLAQMFIYEMSQMYVARGGQTVFSSIDFDLSIPEVFRDIPAVLPGGKIRERVTYGDFEDEAKKLLLATIDVYMEGDYQGKAFIFPKFEVQIEPNELNGNEEILMKISRLAAKYGTPYYIIKQPHMPKLSAYQCCAYLMHLDYDLKEGDIELGGLRNGGMQVISINLPRIAYESKDEIEFFELLEERMNKVKEILLLKRDLIEKELKNGLLPFLSQEVNGRRYLEPKRQKYNIGMIGANEMALAFTGEEIHEPEGWKFALKVFRKMREITDRFKEETGLNFCLARTPAESSAGRLARIDISRYPQAVYNGENESAYYTNSFHVRPNADIPLWKRLSIEGPFHPITTGGAMSHVWLGEANPDPDGILELTKRIISKTKIQYFAFTKDISICNSCNGVFGGLLDKCPNCGNKNMEWWSRITGYYQNISGWNEGKKQELRDRRRYGVS